MGVFLVRHAEDVASVADRFADEGLSPTGREQARALGRALGKIDLGLCLSSPLRRAVETVELALEDRKLPVCAEPALAEGALGELEGLSRAEAVERYPGDLRLGPSVVALLAASGRTAPGGETREAFLARAARAARLVRDALETSSSEVLVVSHGGLLNYLLQMLLEMSLRDAVPFGFDHCGGVHLLSWQEGAGFGPFPMLRFAPL